MDKLLEGIGAALSGLPPALAAAVIIALAVLGLIYAWRKAGDEAKRERVKAEDARYAGAGAQMGRLIDGQDEILSILGEVKSDTRVLIDRGKR